MPHPGPWCAQGDWPQAVTRVIDVSTSTLPIALEAELTRIWTNVVTPDLESNAQGLYYQLKSTHEIHEVPLFLMAVCLVLRAHVLGAASGVSAPEPVSDTHSVSPSRAHSLRRLRGREPRWMGVPGTQHGLRSNLRHLIAQTPTPCVADICDMYRTLLNDLFFFP